MFTFLILLFTTIMRLDEKQEWRNDLIYAITLAMVLDVMLTPLVIIIMVRAASAVR